MIARLTLAAGLLALGACVTPVEEKDAPASAAEAQKAPPAPSRAASPPKVAVAPPTVPPSDPVAAQPPAAPRTRVTEVDMLLTDFERVRRLPAPDLAREQEAARQAFNQSRSDVARVRLAMTMAIPGIPGADDARALEMLDPLVKNPAAPLHSLAFLMTAYIQEQRRLAVQVQGLQQSTQALQQNVQALQQKLDALRTLERSLSEREAATRRRK